MIQLRDQSLRVRLVAGHRKLIRLYRREQPAVERGSAFRHIQRPRSQCLIQPCLSTRMAPRGKQLHPEGEGYCYHEPRPMRRVPIEVTLTAMRVASMSM